MGSCNSQQSKVVPIKLDKTKPLPALNKEAESSVELNGSTDRRSTRSTSSCSNSTQRMTPGPPGRTVRPLSRVSRKSGRIGGGMYAGMGRRTVRPISRTDSLNLSFSKTKTTFGASGGLNDSQNSNSNGHFRQVSVPDPNQFESSSYENENAVLLRTAGTDSVPATVCPCCLSQFSKIVHIPYLLLCGHSFCSSCISIALKNDPSFLKCGICSVNTSVQPQTETSDLVKNEPILELLENKDYHAIFDNSVHDRCAECDREIAIVYCSDCSASFCAECNHQQHTGSRVRSKHKPISINLKPKPQPTCKKHPGQSCVLYCETERQPMCVLCKFYGHHKFHNYQLLNNSSAAYKSSLGQKLAQAKKIEQSLSRAAQNLTRSKREIKAKAMEAQEKLERSFEEAKEELIAALEQREATLLVLLDRQVQMREEIIQEEQEEIAFARARTIAAIEEAKKLLDVNPISALLSRKHNDGEMETVLKRTISVSVDDETTDNGDNPDQIHNTTGYQLLPLGLRSSQELSKKMTMVMEQHGVILQLPNKPIFSHIKLLKDCILIHWQLSNGTHEVMSDRTLTFILQCFADIPYKLMKKDNLFSFSKRFQTLGHQTSILPNGTGITPDSGYQDEVSERSSQVTEVSDNRTAGPSLPSLPPNLHSNNNTSLKALHESNTSVDESKTNASIHEESVPRPTAVLSNLIINTSGSEIPTQNLPLGLPALKNNSLTQSMRMSGALLSLPPLLQTKKEPTMLGTHEKMLSITDSYSSVSGQQQSGVSDTENTHQLNRNASLPLNDTDSDSSDNSVTSLTVGDEENVIDLGKYCKGLAFEEIYFGKEKSFRYSGLIRGATYYFRLRCQNAAGRGPWSNTFKCTVPLPLTN